MKAVVSRALRAVLTVGVGAALLLPAVSASGSATAATNPPPGQDPFYQPPTPLPPGQPGDVIRSRTATFAISSSVKSWQVLYRSQTATDAPDAVSGTVLVPDKPWTGAGARPLVSYAVGTRGLGDQCAPSYTLSQGTDYEELFINDLLNRGWAVAVTDMEGLGTPGEHTYMVGRSQGHAVLDIARAAERLPDTGLGGDSPLGVMGYSQGGASAGWAAQLAPSYAPELNLKGVDASGVPADLAATGKFLDGSIGAGLAFMAALGYNTAYPELNLDSYLNDAGRKLEASDQNVCLLSVDGIGAIAATAFRHISDFTTHSPLDAPDWQARFNDNKLGSLKPAVPVFQGHGVVDELVPFAQAQTLHQDWCKLGVNLTWKTYPGEHALGMVESWPDASTFIADRFAGKPVTSNC